MLIWYHIMSFLSFGNDDGPVDESVRVLPRSSIWILFDVFHPCDVRDRAIHSNALEDGVARNGWIPSTVTTPWRRHGGKIVPRLEPKTSTGPNSVWSRLNLKFALGYLDIPIIFPFPVGPCKISGEHGRLFLSKNKPCVLHPCRLGKRLTLKLSPFGRRKEGLKCPMYGRMVSWC